MNKPIGYIYLMDISEPLERFRSYHHGYANLDIPAEQHERYIAMVVEQMFGHFETESVAVQSFIAHYTLMITENFSPRFMYHPLRFLKQMDEEGYRGYLYCLYGFSLEMHRLLLENRFYSSEGALLASHDHIEKDTLYLVIRPEVPDVFNY